MKSQADKHRTERTFEVGDQVFLCLQPYIQQFVVRRKNHKLAFKFFGPFTVVDRVGAVAYKLNLPETSKVHPVFHVSQLKPCVSLGVQVSPSLCVSDCSFPVPEQVLQSRVRQWNDSTVAQVLVQWSGLPAEEATWEDYEALRQQFLRAPAWGQAGFQAPGIVNDLTTMDKSQATQDGGEDDGPKVTRPARKKRPPRWIAGEEWAR